MRPSFFEGVFVAAVAALLAAILYTVSASLMNGTTALRLIVAGVALGYVLYLLTRSPQHHGRLASLAAWAIAAIVVGLVVDGLLPYVLANILLIWLLRSFNFYTSLIAALLDLALSFCSAIAAVWAIGTTGSLAAAVWCAFLIQALFIFIPRDGMRSRTRRALPPDDRFQRALQAAEAAVSKLSTYR